MKDQTLIAAEIQKLKAAQQKRIRRIVCSGGGAKGVVYPGSYKAMTDTGLLREVEELAGASAGAITAALIAVGMSTDVFREKLLTTNLKELMGTRVGSLLKKNPTGISFLTRDGRPLEQFLRDNLIETVRDNLRNIEEASDLAKEHPELNEILVKIEEDNPIFTFADLAVLNRLFPQHFKQLTVSAVQFPHGEVQVFNSKLTPDVEIALACRASASIPVILEPVEITIDGKTQKYVDGGLFDNLPTDFFDQEPEGGFIKNTKPEQTMVFAFGEGLDNKKNQVFQALYGERWDEVFTDEILATIISEAIELAQNSVETQQAIVLNVKEEAKQLSLAIKTTLMAKVEKQEISPGESKILLATMEKVIANLLLNRHRNGDFWIKYENETTNEGRIGLLGQMIKEKMKPILYKAGAFEKLKRNVLVEVLGDFHAPYKNTAQKEIGYQRLRTEYALRTVELRVGNIKTTDFDEATRLARVMDALGYLDTINHITNHDLHDEEFNSGAFFVDLVSHFEAIYTAVLEGAGKEPAHNKLMQTMIALRGKLEASGKSNEVIARQIYQLIKDRVEEHLDSPEAFALSRTVEFHNNTLSANELFRETYEEGFRRAGVFSLSKITGERIFSFSTLHHSLQDKNMFELYRNQSEHTNKTRTDKVFDALSRLEDFYDETPQPPEEPVIDGPSG